MALENKKTKKKTTKKATEKKKSGSSKQTALTAAELKKFKEILMRKRKDLVGNVNEMKDEALKKSRLDAAGDLSSMPIHMADIGSDTYEQEFALGLMDSERKLLGAIDNALARIERKTYGICEGTGKPIGKARLAAKPWARFSVEYARKLELHLVPEPEDYENGLQ